MSRVEGQIWVDRKSPYRLKYYVKGQEFEVSVLQNYKAGAGGLKAGQVVKIKDGVLSAAVYPKDINRVIGVVMGNSSAGNTVSIAVSDSLYLDSSEIQNIFHGTSPSSLLEAGTGTPLIGAPVYWYIGNIDVSGSTYTYTDSSEFPGRLTIDTPSGRQWGKTSIENDSLNVGYSNLPTIGYISDVGIHNGGISYIVIKVHMSGFSLSQEWSWPLFYNNPDNPDNPVGTVAGYGTGQRSSETIVIRHGLFPDNEYDDGKVGRVRCFCDVMAMGIGSDEEYNVQAAVDNFIGHDEDQPASPDRRTVVTISTPETLRYSITGRVLYNFNKE